MPPEMSLEIGGLAVSLELPDGRDTGARIAFAFGESKPVGTLHFERAIDAVVLMAVLQEGIGARGVGAARAAAG